jgi:integrase
MSTKQRPGRVFKRGRIWWIDYSHRGKRHMESSGSYRKSDAVALLAKRLGEIGRGRLIGARPEKVTLGELCDGILADYRRNEHRSIRRVEISTRNLKAHFGEDTAALDITHQRLEQYIDVRLDAGVSRGTVCKELSALKRAFRLAVKAGTLPHGPEFPSLNADNPRQGFLERAEFDAVLKLLPEYLRPPLEFAYITGWRFASEVLTLTWAQVDLEAKTVRLEPGTTKNKEGRNFPFGDVPELEALLRGTRTRQAFVREVLSVLSQ